MRSQVAALVESPRVGDLRALLAHIEFQLRVLGLLIAAADHSVRPELPGSIDRWRRFIHSNARLLGCQKCETLCQQAADLPSIYITPTQSVLAIRNQIFHGGPEPSDLDVAVLAQAVEDNASRIQLVLNHGHIQDPAPYFQLFGEKAAVLHDFDSWVATYWPREGAAIDTREVSVLAALESLVDASGDKSLASYMSDVERDLRGFAESGRARLYIDQSEPGSIAADWALRTTSGQERRLDRFLLRSDMARLWVNGSGDPVPYPEFLAEISNWQLLKRRLADDLETQFRRQGQVHKDLFGGETARIPNVESSARLARPGWEPQPPEPLSRVFSRIVSDAGLYRGGTALVTLTGEAGSGKTHSLLHLARTSLAPDTGLGPVIIYVSSSGKSLNTIETLLNDAVAGTRILDRAGVLALCRAGLVVLVIDGFDELLGFRAYDDPIRGIRPLLDELRGCGTLILSSRSSYAELRVRPNIAQHEQMHWPPLAQSVELLPWTDAEVRDLLNVVPSAAAAYAEAGPDVRSLLTTPFFTLAFLSWGVAGSPEAGFLEYVTDRYLEREKGKLQMAQGQLFTKEILSRIFGEVAEMSARSVESEITEEDLALAAEQAIGRSLIAEERRRLTSICGMSAEWSENEHVFTFSHPVLAEVFLADQLARSSTMDAIITCLSTVVVTPLCARILTSSRESNWNWLEVVERLKQTVSGRDELAEDAPERKSLGVLWVSQVDSGAITGGGLSGASLDAVNIGGAGPYFFDNCSIGVLVVPGGCRVSIINSTVKLLDVRGIGNVTQVELDDASNINEVLTDRELIAGRMGVRKALGVPIPETVDPLTEEAYDFFGAMIRDLPGNSLIVDSVDYSMERDDGKPGWVHKYGSELWRRYLRDLEDAGNLETAYVNARGRRKTRLKFTA